MLLDQNSDFLFITSPAGYMSFTFHHSNTCPKVKEQESLYRLCVAQRVPGGLGSQIFVTFGT
jgi:hypothetical protein